MEKIIINDIVHGIIRIPPHVKTIIDTPIFQRLRSIGQLGIANYVYPSASYSRFEHSIGTFHLASKLAMKLRDQIITEKLPDVLLTEADVKCIEIAALCHDVGHGPFSHMWDHIVVQTDEIGPSVRKSHEELSVEILGDIMNMKKTNEDKTIKEKIKLDDTSVELIGRIILGEYDVIMDKKRRFLFEIVANKSSGLDVDKFDYICRDIVHLGWSNKNKIHDIERILNFFRITKDGSGEWRLAMRDREIFHIHDIFYTRHMLHRYAYQHKTLRGLECMFKMAMQDILRKHQDELFEIVTGEKDKKSDSFIYSKEFICKARDYHVWTMMYKHSPGTVANINERRLFKLFCKLKVTLNKETIERWHGDMLAVESLLNEIDIFKKKSDTFIHTTTSKFSLRSEKEGDPMLLIPFYKKESLKQCFVFKDHPDRLPELVKLVSDEWILLIFTESEADETSRSCLDTIKSILCEKKQSGTPKEWERRLLEYAERYEFSNLEY